jgi:hypothetical protein
LGKMPLCCVVSVKSWIENAVGPPLYWAFCGTTQDHPNKSAAAESLVGDPDEVVP